MIFQYPVRRPRVRIMPVPLDPGPASGRKSFREADVILFVCHGNVARSQYAQALYCSLTGQAAESAGTHVRPEKTGVMLQNDGEAARRAVEYLRECSGIDISRQQRKPLTKEAAARAEKIIVLTDREHLPAWFSECEGKTEFWTVADPHDMDSRGYEETINLIKQRLEDLISSRSPQSLHKGQFDGKR